MYASSGYVSSAFCFIGNFVDFIDVDNSVLGQVFIAIGIFDEIANEVVDVAADVAGFGKLGSIGFYEWHSNQFRDVAHQVGFSNACRSEQDDILLGVVAIFDFRILKAAADVVIVVADGDGNHLLGFLLLDDETV